MVVIFFFFQVSIQLPEIFVNYSAGFLLEPKALSAYAAIPCNHHQTKFRIQFSNLKFDKKRCNQVELHQCPIQFIRIATNSFNKLDIVMQFIE